MGTGLYNTASSITEYMHNSRSFEPSTWLSSARVEDSFNRGQYVYLFTRNALASVMNSPNSRQSSLHINTIKMDLKFILLHIYLLLPVIIRFLNFYKSTFATCILPVFYIR